MFTNSALLIKYATTVWVIIFEGLNFRSSYNFKFPWVLIFVSAVFRVYLKSRFVFKVIMETTRKSSVIRGHHIYKEVWEPIHGQILQCTRERSNRFDPFAVSIVNSEEIVGHMPRRISAACALFLQHHRSIRCEVTGDRRHSSDLSQGGLEVPCDLIFEGEKKYIQKIEKGKLLRGSLLIRWLKLLR